MTKCPTFEIIAGSYEEFLLGYNFSSESPELVQSFAAHDHSASIRCVAASGHLLASGAADDRIFIYDLKTRKQHCTLTHHNATVSCLQFTENRSHLVSGSSDGVLAVVRVGSWQVEKVWEKAHKGAAVLDIAVHASGKLALTLGSDGSLCTWNLIKGRQAYVINLKSKSKDARSLEKILWGPDGIKFVLFGGKFTEIWSIESGGFEKQIEHKEKVTACLWLSDDVLLVGHENGEITKLNLSDDSKKLFKAHESRVKSIDICERRLITISSNGQIKVWNRGMKQLAMVESNCRLTCLCVVTVVKVKTEENVEEEVIDSEESVQKKEKITKRQVIEIVEDDDDDDNDKRVTRKRKKKVKK